MNRSLSVLALALAACASGPPANPQSSSPKAANAPEPAFVKALAEARAGVDDIGLQDLLEAHWAWELKDDPLRATGLGVHRYDDRLPDRSEAGIAERRRRRAAFLKQLEAIAPGQLTRRDAVTYAMLETELRTAVASEVCDFHEWTLSARSNPVTQFNYLPELHKVRSPSDASNLLARYHQIAGAIDDTTAALTRGAARGLFAPQESVRRVLEMVDKQLGTALDEWPLLKPARAPKADWPGGEHALFAKQLREVVATDIVPALKRYGDLVRERIFPKARDEEHSGLWALPVGKACYAARIRAFTTLSSTPEEIHSVGVNAIAKTDSEMAALGKKVMGTGSLAETLVRLREDKSLYFDTEEAVEAAARKTLQLGKAKMGDFFGVLPKASCKVVRIPDYEAPYTTIAYYRPAHADGSKPGEYFVNVYEPTTRPRFEAAVLAVHEAIPGHHLQIAISQELGSVPAFRKHGGVTAYVEGWALYTERLADEMGLYENDLDRIGMVSFDAWRAGRLVVDTGIHALGWSRKKARDYLEAHTALSPENIDNEVDRYINWPGQALGYKIGQIEIWKLRREAEAALGDSFSLKSFHDTVLRSGAITLPLLRANVLRFVEKARAARVR